MLNEIRSEAQVMSTLGRYLRENHSFRVFKSLILPVGNHPNIVSFIGAVTKSYDDDSAEEHSDDEEAAMRIKNRNKLCLVLEYCPRGSLYDCLIKRREKVCRD